MVCPQVETRVVDSHIPPHSAFPGEQEDVEEYGVDLGTPLNRGEGVFMNSRISKKSRESCGSTVSMSSSFGSPSDSSSSDEDDDKEANNRLPITTEPPCGIQDGGYTDDYDGDEATDRVPAMMDLGKNREKEQDEESPITTKRTTRKALIDKRRVSFDAMSLRSTPKSLRESESGQDHELYPGELNQNDSMDISFGFQHDISSRKSASSSSGPDYQRRKSSTVRFGSIVLNELQVEAIQEELAAKEEKKTWFQRRRECSRRAYVQGRVKAQMKKLHKAHKSSTLLNKKPDEREQAKKLTTSMYPSPTGEGLSVSIKFSGKESQSFYTKMKAFSAFKDVTKDEYYQLAPKDWYVVITDVKGSTKAIEAGRYKDVNTIGAASISVVMKNLDDDFPFVFGGDGATLLIPPSDIGRVLESLLRLQRLSEEQFDLGLRVGYISVADVNKAGGRIEVAKHELTAGRCVAIFRGGGLTVAEGFIKGQEDKYCVKYKSREDVDLEGLSCRWNNIPNKRGKIMSLLVCAREEEDPTEIYNYVLHELDKIYDGKLDEANPVNCELMTYKRVSQIIEDEKRWSSNKVSTGFFGRIAEIFLAVGIFKHNIDPKLFDSKHYFESMPAHADHRKFDDMLRMIIDCSEDQAEEIEGIMEDMYMDGKIHYGIFLSDTALMTCYLEDLVDGQHIHFIDGGDGGYAMAAKQLKAQIKSDLLASD